MRCRNLGSGAWALGLFLTTGCGESAKSTPSPAPSEADAGRDATPLDAGDPNGTFDRARELTVGAFPGQFESLDGREDSDFYWFDGTEGEWVTIRTTDISQLSFTDTPITLYGPDRTQLAANRYATSLFGEDVLSRLVTRLPVTGKYFIGISNLAAPTVALGYSQPYRISVVDLDTLDGYSVNTEGDAPTPVRLKTWSTPGGMVDDVFFSGALETADDRDAFSFEITDDARLLDAKVEPSGTFGDGSTSLPGDLWITDATGDQIIARIDGAAGQTSLTPPLPAGKYLFWAGHPASDLGANDFYVVRALVAPDNPVESEDATNGKVESAESMQVEALDATGTQLQAFILSHLGPGDVDYFRFEGKPGQIATIDCVSRGDGSGVVKLNVSARNEKDESLAEATEALDKSVTLDSIQIPDTGTLYLRLSKDSQLSDVTGDWTRCVVSSN